MQRIGLFAVLLAVIGAVAMAQENRKADDLTAHFESGRYASHRPGSLDRSRFGASFI
jgi:hypothetical protein